MTEYNTEQFEKDCKALGVTISDEQIRQFLKYFELLVEWNEVMNLTAITEYDEVMKKHFVDSISLCKAYDVSQKKTVIDVGTGAGFPGLALKIAFPNLQVTLLDSLNKRINFLNEVISTLGLTGVETIHGRAEDYAKPGIYTSRFGYLSESVYYYKGKVNICKISQKSGIAIQRAFVIKRIEYIGDCPKVFHPSMSKLMWD